MLIDHKTQSHMAIDEKYAVLKHSPSSTFISCLAGITTIDPHLSDSITVFTDNTISNFVTTLNLVKTIAQLITNGRYKVQNLQSGADPLGFRDAGLEDRLSDLSNSVLSQRDSDDSVSCSTDFAVFFLTPTNQERGSAVAKLTKCFSFMFIYKYFDLISRLGVLDVVSSGEMGNFC